MSIFEMIEKTPQFITEERTEKLQKRGNFMLPHPLPLKNFSGITLQNDFI